MNNKQIVLVDMDDTLCHFIQRCLYHYNMRWPSHPIEYDKCSTWIHEGAWHPECTKEDFFGKPGLYEELELFDEHVIPEMQKLADAYEVIIVTAAWPQAVVEKWNWMQQHLPFIPYDNFCTWKKKYHINGDILIDDAVHNLMPFAESGRAVIGIPHPWNASIRDQVYFKYDGWKNMKEKVDQILIGEVKVS